MADSTADSTAIIIIDSTSTDVQNLEETVANSLVSDFGAKMGPLGLKCDKLSGQTNRIKDQISGMTPSGTDLLDRLLANAMNAAFGSSAWALAQEVSGNISDTLNKCSYLKEAANDVAKYADPSKFLKSLAGAATEKAEQAIDAIADQFGGSDNFPELGIGKALADLAATGRTIQDKVEKGLESVEEAISPVIESGKAAVNAVQTELAAAAKELAKMDKLINCVAGLGGPDMSGTVDDMIDQLDCYYDKLGVYSDPAFANFGEFDMDTFLGGIGAIDAQTADNIKKGMNLYSKTRKNAEGAVEKAADLGIKTPSALTPGAQSDTTVKKTAYTEAAAKTSKTIPAIPGKTTVRTVTLPTPDPVSKPSIVSAPPPVPITKVPYTQFIVDTWVKPLPSYESKYLKWDPGQALLVQFESALYSKVANIMVDDPGTNPRLELRCYLESTTARTREEGWFDKKRILAGYQGGLIASIVNLDNEGRYPLLGVGQTAWADNWVLESYILEASKEELREMYKDTWTKAWMTALQSVEFDEEFAERTLG